MEPTVTNQEKGQNIILVAILMLFFLGLLALVIDGGMAYARRRAAQNAADAGALAGANRMCALDQSAGPSPTEAAWDYVHNRNEAPKADITIVGKEITVTAIMTQTAFFAQLFGNGVVTETATASAGCSSACSAPMMPVAWACQPPLHGPQPTPGGPPIDPPDSCGLQYGSYNPPVAGPLYVIMDSNKAAVDYTCQTTPGVNDPPGAVNCDINGDGVNDLVNGGGRSWLDLNGGTSNANELKDWITGASSQIINIPTWLPGAQGTTASVFGSATVNVGQIFLLPVFNKYTVNCDPSTDLACSWMWETGDQIKQTSGASKDYYHVVSISAFMVTCVGDKPHSPCAAKNYLLSQCALTPQPSYCAFFSANDRTIEGYFVQGYIPGATGNCENNNSGVYTIYLHH